MTEALVTFVLVLVIPHFFLILRSFQERALFLFLALSNHSTYFSIIPLHPLSMVLHALFLLSTHGVSNGPFDSPIPFPIISKKILALYCLGTCVLQKIIEVELVSMNFIFQIYFSWTWLFMILLFLMSLNSRVIYFSFLCLLSILRIDWSTCIAELFFLP